MNPLAPFGKLYGRIMDLRNVLYDRDALKSYDLGARTISVGNLTTGGTGKTPLVALVANILMDEGETVCILTRGYGRRSPKTRVLVSDGTKILVDAAIGGDEPVELARKLDGKAVIIADPDRVAAAKWARDSFSISTFILDDGFQHRRARRDLDIVCIDATNPCGNGRILPAGTLRESFKSLSRADAIVITRSDLVESTNDLRTRLRRRTETAPIFLAATEVRGFVRLEEFHTGISGLQPAPESAFVFTAIGNAENFVQTLVRSGIHIKGQLTFRDHHRFTQADVNNIKQLAKEQGAVALVTAAKDAVKLQELAFKLPCWVTIAETKIENFDVFRTLVRG